MNFHALLLIACLLVRLKCERHLIVFYGIEFVFVVNFGRLHCSFDVGCVCVFGVCN